MAQSKPPIGSFRNLLSLAMGHPTLTTSSLLLASATAAALKNPKVRARVGKQVQKTRLRMYVKPCPGVGCETQGYHTHDLRVMGKWHFIWRYKFYNAVLGDPRPQPPVGQEGSTWFAQYAADWRQAFSEFGTDTTSCWVRDKAGYWVWVTDSPQFDRNWFDDHGWRFPAAWITSEAKRFYTVGRDELSTIVSLPVKEGVGSEPKDGTE